MLLSGVSQAMGLPVDLSQVANGQPLEQSLLNTGLGLLADPESDLSRELAGMNETTRKLTEVYRHADEVQQELAQGIATARELEEEVRQPTLEGLARVGGLIYEQLGEPERAEWRQIARATKPVVALVDLARTPGSARAAVEKYLAAQLADPAELSQLVDTALASAPDGARLYADLLQRVARDANLALEDQRRLLDAIARG